MSRLEGGAASIKRQYWDRAPPPKRLTIYCSNCYWRFHWAIVIHHNPMSYRQFLGPKASAVNASGSKLAHILIMGLRGGSAIHLLITRGQRYGVRRRFMDFPFKKAPSKQTDTGHYFFPSNSSWYEKSLREHLSELILTWVGWQTSTDTCPAPIMSL